MSSLSLADLARFLMNVRLAMLTVFVFALLRSGASLFLAGVALAVGVGILTAVDMRYDTYPFLLTTPLFVAALYAVSRSLPHGSLDEGGLLVAAGLLGAVTAFGANVRTSQIPSYATMAAIFLYDATRRSSYARSASRRLRAAAIWCAVFVAGYTVFHALFIASLRPSEHVPNYAYHAFGHSLVIGLGVPETPFSRSQGLRWEDGVAFAIATRAGVEPLGPKYEATLLRYYGGLWRQHPGEMWRTYATKFRSACDEVFLSAGIIARRFGVTSSAFEWLHRHTDGYVLFGMVALIAGLAARATGQGSGVGFLFWLIAATAFFTLLESALVYSTFVAMYFSYFLFFLFLSGAAAIQWLVDCAAPPMLLSEGAATRMA
jgi:hypothetical protein